MKSEISKQNEHRGTSFAEQITELDKTATSCDFILFRGMEENEKQLLKSLESDNLSKSI